MCAAEAVITAAHRPAQPNTEQLGAARVSLGMQQHPNKKTAPSSAAISGGTVMTAAEATAAPTAAVKTVPPFAVSLGAVQVPSPVQQQPRDKVATNCPARDEAGMCAAEAIITAAHMPAQPNTEQLGAARVSLGMQQHPNKKTAPSSAATSGGTVMTAAEAEAALTAAVRTVPPIAVSLGAVQDHNDDIPTTSPEEDMIEELLNDVLREKQARKMKRTQAIRVLDQILAEDQSQLEDMASSQATTTMHEVIDSVVDDKQSPTTTPSQETQKPRQSIMREKFLSREDDAENMDRECARVKRRAMEFNKRLTNRICSNKLEGKPTQAMEIEDKVLTFGSVELDDNEIELLKLGPGYMVVATPSEEEMRTECTVSLTKMRWDRMGKGDEGLTSKEIEAEMATKSVEEIENEEAVEEEINREARDVLDEKGETLDMRKLRATDMEGNRRVIMPPPAKPIIEAEYNTRNMLWLKEFNNFRQKFCDEEGNQTTSNLSLGQTLGLKSLSKKVSKLECIVLEADKGKTFVVVDEANYRAMAQDHVGGDEVVSQEEVKDSQRVLTTTGKSLANVLNLGQNHGWKNYVRCFDNTGSMAEDVPNLKLLPKVHKPPTAQGHPQSRPVVAASSGISSRAGDLLSDFLQPLVTACIPRQEDMSTEEVVAQLEEAQLEVKRLGLRNTMAGSLDVRALYPSLDQDGASESVAKFIRESKVEIKGINWREAQVFLGSNMDEHKLKREKALDLVPKRANVGGKRPGKTTLELRQRAPNPKAEGGKPKASLWAPSNPDEELSDTQKKCLLSLVVKVATRNVFRHHLYSFAGDPRRQSRGGPIGLRLTSIVARIVMDQWISGFIVAVMDAGLTIHAIMKYVDDVNLVCSRLPLGTRWIGGKFVTRDEWAADDARGNRSEEDVTIEAVRAAADSVVVYLEFTSDIPERHASGMVPMLDIQVWVEHPDPDLEDGSDTIGWTFFEKASASVKVLRASTAYPWRSKIVTLGMETFRRMRNITRQVSEDARVECLAQFIVKMRRSGYVQASVQGILESGVTLYYRKLKVDLEGGPRLNARKENETVARRRAKLGASEKWFARRRGGDRELESKTNGWRVQGNQDGQGRCWMPTNPRGKRAQRQTHKKKKVLATETEGDKECPRDKRTITTLLVDYSVGSRLKSMVQKTEDQFAEMVGGGRVRVLEKGGDVLVNILGRNNPWAAKRSCKDPTCHPCKSRAWITEQKKVARREKMDLPECLLTRSSHQCRREGANYSLQCLPCALSGVKSIYWGETSRSTRQRLQEHDRDSDQGLVSGPMVQHAIEAHGGTAPHYLGLVHTIEPRPLYRAVRESVYISMMPAGIQNINRCQEWGAPRVPVLSAAGGDQGGDRDQQVVNPRPLWSIDKMHEVRTGQVKRIMYWDEHKDDAEGPIHPPKDALSKPGEHHRDPGQPEKKRLRQETEMKSRLKDDKREKDRKREEGRSEASVQTHRRTQIESRRDLVLWTQSQDWRLGSWSQPCSGQ